MEQVSYNTHNNSSTHTIRQEIDEYMHHNPDCKGVRMFILPIEDFNNGECDVGLYWDDGIE